MRSDSLPLSIPELEALTPELTLELSCSTQLTTRSSRATQSSTPAYDIVSSYAISCGVTAARCLGSAGFVMAVSESRISR